MSERIVKVCCGTGCLANGSKKILEALRAEIEKRKIDIEVVPYVKSTGCNGLCEKGPIVKIYPDDIAYYRVGLNDVREIIEKTIIKDEAVEKLLYLDLKTKKRIRSHSEPDFIKKQTKIALRNIGEIDPSDIHDYLAVGGYQALKKALKMSGDDIISDIKKSGLRGLWTEVSWKETLIPFWKE